MGMPAPCLCPHCEKLFDVDLDGGFDDIYNDTNIICEDCYKYQQKDYNELKGLIKFDLLGEYLAIIFSYQKLEIEEEKEVNRLLQDSNIEKNQLIMINFVERWKEERNKLKYQKGEQIELLFQLIKRYELALFGDNMSNHFYFDYKKQIYYIDKDTVRSNFCYSDFTSLQIELSKREHLKEIYLEFQPFLETISKQAFPNAEITYIPVDSDIGEIRIKNIQFIDIENCLGCGGEHKSLQVIDNVFYCPNNRNAKKITVSQDK